MRYSLEKLGERLREARQRRAISQPEMARLLGKSKQLVSAWEQGRSEILVSTLASFAQILSADINWLILGIKNSGDDAGFPSLPQGMLVPVLLPLDVIAISCGRQKLESIDSKAYTYFPTPPGSLAFEQTDSSMQGIISRGELVVIAPANEIGPCDLVAVVVFTDMDVTLEEPIFVLREIRFLSTRIGHAPFELVARGRGYSKITINKTEHAKIAGKVNITIRRSFSETVQSI